MDCKYRHNLLYLLPHPPIAQSITPLKTRLKPAFITPLTPPQ